MSLSDPISPERALVAGAFGLSALAAGATAWLHAKAFGGLALPMCGAAAEPHCWACYAAPALALAGLTTLLLPERSPQRARA